MKRQTCSLPCSFFRTATSILSTWKRKDCFENGRVRFSFSFKKNVCKCPESEVSTFEQRQIHELFVMERSQQLLPLLSRWQFSPKRRFALLVLTTPPFDVTNDSTFWKKLRKGLLLFSLGTVVAAYNTLKVQWGTVVGDSVGRYYAAITENGLLFCIFKSNGIKEKEYSNLKLCGI